MNAFSGGIIGGHPLQAPAASQVPYRQNVAPQGWSTGANGQPVWNDYHTLGLQPSGQNGPGGATAKYADLMAYNPDSLADWDDNSHSFKAHNPALQQYLYDNELGEDGNVSHHVGVLWDKLPKTAMAGDGHTSGSVLGHAIGAPDPKMMTYRNAVKWDPNYGYVTDDRNFKEPTNYWETAASTLGTAFIGGIALAPLMAAASAAAGGGFTGSLASGLVRQAPSMLMSGGKSFNPMGLAMGAAGGMIPGMGQISPYLNYAKSAYALSKYRKG